MVWPEASTSACSSPGSSCQTFARRVSAGAPWPPYQSSSRRRQPSNHRFASSGVADRKEIITAQYPSLREGTFPTSTPNPVRDRGTFTATALIPYGIGAVSHQVPHHVIVDRP